jgi:large subunit ribosomal protein L1
MPNPKYGTVTTNITETVTRFRRGEAQFRNDKDGNVSMSIGRASFTDEQLSENLAAVMKAIMSQRPSSVPGSGMQGFVERVTLSMTQGKGFPVVMSSLRQAVWGHALPTK